MRLSLRLLMPLVTKSFKPPPAVKGIVPINRDLFNRVAFVPTLSFPKETYQRLRKVFGPYLLQLKKVPSVVENTDASKKSLKVLLNPDLMQDKGLTASDLKAQISKALNGAGVADLEVAETEISLGYQNWSYDDILSAVLPDELGGISSFSQCGHIVHLNLKDHLLPYKSLIGEVMLDNVANCRTVVNKMENIGENVFRTFGFEVLAGESDFICTVKEHGCQFCFDFSKVYWNSRLSVFYSAEHHRIVSLLSKDSLLFDVFAGVGPFAIPAAGRVRAVFANDLNLESFKWLQHNCRLNKVERKVNTFNLDGGDFIRTILRDELVSEILRRQGKPEESLAAASTNPSLEPSCDATLFHVAMNLPALAVTFLPHFVGLLAETPFARNERLNMRLVCLRIHCYCFSKAPKENDFKADALRQVLDGLGLSSADELCADYLVHDVRNVSAFKEMMCVSFTLPNHLLSKPQPEPYSDHLGDVLTDVPNDLSEKRPVDRSADSEAKRFRIFE